MEQETLSIEQVKKIAQLCKLDVTGSEQKLAEMFNDTLKYIKILEELNLQNIKETYQVTGLVNVFQNEDENNATISSQEALQNTKEKINNLFATKAVFKR